MSGNGRSVISANVRAPQRDRQQRVVHAHPLAVPERRLHDHTSALHVSMAAARGSAAARVDTVVVSDRPRLCKNAISVRFREYQNPSRPQINRIQRVLRGRRCGRLVLRGVLTQPRPGPDRRGRYPNRSIRSFRIAPGRLGPQIRLAPHLLATTVYACPCATPGGLVPGPRQPARTRPPWRPRPPGSATTSVRSSPLLPKLDD